MERYGVKPKKFTAAWFDYVWEYYKLHIIAVVLIVAAIIYTVIAFSTRTYYDFNICFAGETLLTDESKQKLSDVLKENLKDVNGDGEINIKIDDYSIGKNTQDGEYIAAMQTRLYLELQAGEAYIFVLSEDNAWRLKNDSATEGLFDDASNWAENGKEGEYVKIEESKILNDAGILYENSYIAVRNFIYDEGNDEDQIQRENAIDAANVILAN